MYYRHSRCNVWNVFGYNERICLHCSLFSRSTNITCVCGKPEYIVILAFPCKKIHRILVKDILEACHFCQSCHFSLFKVIQKMFLLFWGKLDLVMLMLNDASAYMFTVFETKIIKLTRLWIVKIIMMMIIIMIMIIMSYNDNNNNNNPN